MLIENKDCNIVRYRLLGTDANIGENIVMLRHAEDVLTIESDLNNHLNLYSISKIKKTASNILELYKNRNCDFGLTLIVSPTIRTMETGKILKHEFDSVGLTTKFFVDSRIRELYHGEFEVDNNLIENGIYTPLRKASLAFHHALDLGNLTYRFGDYNCPGFLEDTTMLKKFFISKGENHLEFSTRVYSFLYDLTFSNPNWLYVIVTHQALVNRTQRMINTYSTSVGLEPGEFVKYIERYGYRYSVDFAEGVSIPLMIFKDFRDKILRKEFCYLIQECNAQNNQEKNN